MNQEEGGKGGSIDERDPVRGGIQQTLNGQVHETRLGDARGHVKGRRTQLDRVPDPHHKPCRQIPRNHRRSAGEYHCARQMPGRKERRQAIGIDRVGQPRSEITRRKPGARCDFSVWSDESDPRNRAETVRKLAGLRSLSEDREVSIQSRQVASHRDGNRGIDRKGRTGQEGDRNGDADHGRDRPSSAPKDLGKCISKEGQRSSLQFWKGRIRDKTSVVVPRRRVADV